MLWCNFGSTGAEGVAPARLTSSLEHSILNAPMLDLTPSVHPVLHFFLHLISRGTQASAKARASDLPTTIGCIDAIGISSSSVTDFSRTRPIQRFFEFFLRVLLCMAFFTSSLGSRNVHLTKPIFPLIVLSYDHQNHSKWHKWCHVRYTVSTSCVGTSS